MDAKEALEQLRIERFWQSERLGASNQKKSMFDTAIKALEKQVPKEPKRKILINNKIFGGECPNCGHEINVASYCPYCGQGIYWEEKE